MSERLAPTGTRSRGASHVLRVTVIGIPVEFVTNEPAVLAVAAAAFGTWRDSRQHHGHAAGAVVRITVDDAAAPKTGGPVAHQLQDAGLVISGRGCIGMTHPMRREAVACIASDQLHDAVTFRTEVLEALTWGLLTRLDRQPLHAAALARDGAALLLHGPCGSGKSTLALAAAHAGMHAAADDMVFLQSRPRLRVWSAPGPLHVLPAAASALGVDTSQATVRMRDGTAKVAVDVRPPNDHAFDRCGLCLLGPGAASARARRLSDAEAIGLLDLRADAGFDVFADSIAPVVAGVVRGGAWLLEPSPSPRDAVALLAAMLDDIAAGGRST
jgi:hypothetical protein